MTKSRLNLVLPASCAAVLLAAAAPVGRTIARSQGDLLRREEIMVLNLDRGPKSVHYYLQETLKSVRAVQKDLEKAKAQVEQVDAAFARARNRPDERTLSATAARISQAEQTARQLEDELKAAQEDLKADIRQTLIK